MGQKKVGWWNEYWYKKIYPDVDGFYVATVEETWSCGPIKDLTDFADGLEVASSYLDKTRYVPVFDKYQAKISQIKSGVDAVRNTASKIGDICDKIAAIHKIDQGVRALIEIGEIQNDPEGAAAAFGKVLSGVGEIASYLPYPVSAYVGILKGAENFFLDMRHKMSEKVHMRESSGGSAPGVRETIDNL